jgi:hypothetical protein
LVHIFICVAHVGESVMFVISPEVTLLLNLENDPTNLCSVVSKATVSVLKVSVALFSSLKQNLMHTNCSFKSAIFQVLHNCRWNNMHFFRTRHYSAIKCYSLIPNRKWLSRLYPVYTYWYKFVLAAVVSSCCHSRISAFTL